MPDMPNTMIVIFSVGDRRLGINIDEIAEIISIFGVCSAAPGKGSPIETLNFRGKTIQVINWRTRMGMQTIPVDGKSRILVLERNGRHLGVLVDSVDLIRYLDSAAMEAFSPGNPASSQVVPAYEHRDLPDQLLSLADADRMDFEVRPRVLSMANAERHVY